MVRRLIMVVPIVALVIGGSVACASKKYVRTSVGDVNDKVDSLGRSVEATQERTRQNEGRISEVDQKAQAAGQAAGQRRSGAGQRRGGAGRERGQRGGHASRRGCRQGRRRGQGVEAPRV